MKRELKVMLRREPEPNHNLDLSNWSLDEVENIKDLSSMWYIEVFP